MASIARRPHESRQSSLTCAILPNRRRAASPASAGSIRRSDIAGDTHVIGCVVEARDPSALRQGEAAVAVSRIATCRAEATERPITSGDLLVVSTIPGHAMAAASPAPGQILGKALDPLQGGTGLIRVLIGAR